MPTQELSSSDIERYSRQLLLRGWSGKFQTSLKNQSYIVPCELPTLGLYMAAAGIGALFFSPTLPDILKTHLHRLRPDIQLGNSAQAPDSALRVCLGDPPTPLADQTEYFQLQGSRLTWLKTSFPPRAFDLPSTSEPGSHFLGCYIASLLLELFQHTEK